MTLRLTHCCFAAAVLAVAAVSLAGLPARAFTFETISPTNPDGSAKLADPDEQVKNGRSLSPFGQNGPFVQFGPQQRPFGRPFVPAQPLAPQPYVNGDN